MGVLIADDAAALLARNLIFPAREMEMSEVDIASYLARIDLDIPATPDVATLHMLQAAHLRSVPFENLSIHSAQPIILDKNALFDKIVTRRRGGFCYELNGLFAVLLRVLGFDVSMISAGVMGGNGEFGPPFDHMALIVRLEDRWLVDVGFGWSFRIPLLLEERAVQTDGLSEYRIDADDPELILLRRDEEGVFVPQYRFTTDSHELSEYGAMCKFHETSPDSFFTQRRMCTRMTDTGRVTLRDNQFITTEADTRTTRDVRDEAEFDALLLEHFGVVV